MSNDKSNGNDDVRGNGDKSGAEPWSLSAPPWFRKLVEDKADADGKSRSRWIRDTVLGALGIDDPNDNQNGDSAKPNQK